MIRLTLTIFPVSIQSSVVSLRTPNSVSPSRTLYPANPGDTLYAVPNGTDVLRMVIPRLSSGVLAHQVLAPISQHLSPPVGRGCQNTCAISIFLCFTCRAAQVVEGAGLTWLCL